MWATLLIRRSDSPDIQAIYNVSPTFFKIKKMCPAASSSFLFEAHTATSRLLLLFSSTPISSHLLASFPPLHMFSSPPYPPLPASPHNPHLILTPTYHHPFYIFIPILPLASSPSPHFCLSKTTSSHLLILFLLSSSPPHLLLISYLPISHPITTQSS